MNAWYICKACLLQFKGDLKSTEAGVSPELEVSLVMVKAVLCW